MSSAERWCQAIDGELEILQRNGKYERMLTRRMVKPVKSKRIFDARHYHIAGWTGTKLRLGAKDVTQHYNVEYTERHCPDVRKSIFAIVALAVKLGRCHSHRMFRLLP